MSSKCLPALGEVNQPESYFFSQLSIVGSVVEDVHEGARNEDTRILRQVKQ
jgi:hypothetical protein